MNQDNSILTITPLGAGNEVGRSCILMQFCGKQIMFDCGIHMNKNYKGVLALPYFNKIDKIEDIDLILITHFHLDHCGALPYFLKNYKFKGKIYMTTPTKEIYGLVLKDSIKVKSEDFSQDLINEQSIEQSLKNIECIDYDQEIYYKGIKIKCYNAGHVLGAAMFMVEIDGVRVLYTGDYSTENERHLRAAQLPNEKIHVLIVEATYGDTQHEVRAKREENFLREIVNTLKQGGNVLLPVFATGRCHELLLILDEYWSKNPDIQQFPIYSTCTLAIKCTHIFQKFFNKLGDRFSKGENLFKFNFINTKKHLQDILNNPKPKIVMASPGLLQSGHSKQIYENWCKDEKNEVIITGPAVQGTIAHQLIHNKESDIKIRAYQISFSAHADYLQTSSFIDSLRPQHVILVHGTEHKCRDLQKKIELNFKEVVEKVWSPENQKQVELTFQRSSVDQAGCKAIGELGNRIEKFIITFQEKHNQHKVDEEIVESMTDCACCTNDLFFNGVLLNTEHGFMLVDESDKQTLQQYGIEQHQIYNQMYVPLLCSLDQVFNYVQKLNPEAQFHPDDNLIVVKDLEIRVTVSRVLLQFKWISSQGTDDLADALAFFLSNVSQHVADDEELLKSKQQGLMKVLQATEFQQEQLGNILQLKSKGQTLLTIDLNNLSVQRVSQDPQANRAQMLVDQYLTNNFFSFFNGPQKKKETKKIIFDENYFNLQITGGKKHSDKIIIEAISIVDSEKLGTDIKWFQIAPNNDFKTLDIVGNEYQPSIEDVGSKFMIQVVPISEGRQYEGMPKSMEIGPLERDEEIQEEIDEMLENEKMTILVTMEKILHLNPEIEAELPLSCLLKVTLKNIELQLKKNEQVIHTFNLPLEAQYPSCKSKQGTSDCFILKLDPNNEFIMKAQDNQMRDVILSVIKGFYGKSIWKLNQIEANGEEESDENDEEEQINKEDQEDVQETQQQNEQVIEQEQVNSKEEIQQQTQEDLKSEEVKEQSIPKTEEELQKQEYEPNIQENIEIKDQELEEQIIEKSELQDEKQEEKQVEQQEVLAQNQINIEQQEENQVITNTQITPKKSEEITEQIQDQTQNEMEQIVLQTRLEDENIPNLVTSEIIVQKEIKQINDVEKEIDPQKQSPQKSRVDHKIQSVIITSESNKEERASPIKKKEKKNNADLYMYLNENVRLKQEIEQFKSLQQKDQEQIKKQQNQILTLSEQLANCTRNYYQLEEECNNQKKIMHSLNDQKVFLQQDINMYKTQLLELTEVSSSQKEEIEQLKKRLQRQAQSQDLSEAKKQIDQLKEQLAKRDLMLEAANQDHISAKKQIEDLEKEIESYQNQLTHEKKKYESLAIEKGIKQPVNFDKQRFNEKQQKQEKQVAQSMIQLDDTDRYSIDISQSLNNLDTDVEVNRLKTQIMHLEATLRRYKFPQSKAQKQHMNKMLDLQKEKQEKGYMEHIANNMAEIITEKETQLENQKKINKELLTKLQILQQQHQ